MSVTYIPNHEEEAIDRLVSQYKDKPRIEAFLKTFVKQYQDLEDVTKQLLILRWVDSSVGAQLDGIGSIVGEKRRGRDDDVYRLAIKLRIAINTSQGTPENLISVFLLVTLCTQAQYMGIFPARCEIYGNSDFSQKLIDNGSDAFAFAGGPDGLGFGDVFDASVGGGFASLVLTDLDYIYFILQSVLPGGVILGHFGFYDGNDAFAFAGSQDYKGFGNVFDSTVGGKFATILF